MSEPSRNEPRLAEADPALFRRREVFVPVVEPLALFDPSRRLVDEADPACQLQVHSRLHRFAPAEFRRHSRLDERDRDFSFPPPLNSTSCEAILTSLYRSTNILRHPHFMAYLRYFICGPDLPKPVVEVFCKVVEDDADTSGMVLDQIKAFVRKAVRDRGLAPGHAADEFYKLAHEIDRGDLAENVRSAAKSVRS